MSKRGASPAPPRAERRAPPLLATAGPVTEPAVTRGQGAHRRAPRPPRTRRAAFGDAARRRRRPDRVAGPRALRPRRPRRAARGRVGGVGLGRRRADGLDRARPPHVVRARRERPRGRRGAPWRADPARDRPARLPAPAASTRRPPRPVGGWSRARRRRRGTDLRSGAGVGPALVARRGRGPDRRRRPARRPRARGDRRAAVHGAVPRPRRRRPRLRGRGAACRDRGRRARGPRRDRARARGGRAGSR